MEQASSLLGPVARRLAWHSRSKGTTRLRTLVRVRTWQPIPGLTTRGHRWWTKLSPSRTNSGSCWTSMRRSRRKRQHPRRSCRIRVGGRCGPTAKNYRVGEDEEQECQEREKTPFSLPGQPLHDKRSYYSTCQSCGDLPMG